MQNSYLSETKINPYSKDCLSNPTANIILLLTIIPTQNCLDETLKTLHFGEQIYLQSAAQSKSKQNDDKTATTNIKLTSSNELLFDYNRKKKLNVAK